MQRKESSWAEGRYLPQWLLVFPVVLYFDEFSYFGAWSSGCCQPVGLFNIGGFAAEDLNACDESGIPWCGAARGGFSLKCGDNVPQVVFHGDYVPQVVFGDEEWPVGWEQVLGPDFVSCEPEPLLKRRRQGCHGLCPCR